MPTLCVCVRARARAREVEYQIRYMWYLHFLLQYCKTDCAVTIFHLGFLGGSDGKESACSAEGPGSIPGVRMIP